ncbi:S41 family peptidase [Marinimicrobium alkaliphilum]|uniref:S41 family peptidase n=1 Tax=Marinimicrobium alkaliphilum TaxID=2202654 RepID=UPI000DBA1083|nr:S41 family peptidase [Marinimicrobium alkaliphilum]
MPKHVCSLMVVWSLLSLGLVGCGGGSSSGSLLRDLVGQQNRSGDWVEGLFLPSSDFRHYCANPRSGSQVADRQGSYVDENNWLRAWNRETYLWYDESPDLDPAGTTRPATYHQQLGRPGDVFRWSQSTEAYRRLTESGVSAGYGIRWRLLRSTAPNRDIRVAYTEPDSPAALAGVPRGARVLSVNGSDAVGGDNVDLLNASLYPDEEDETYTFVFSLPNGETLETQLTSAELTVSPVQTQTVIERPTGHIGYIHFTRHIATAESALAEAIQSLSQAGVSDLVIDLRYNGGGFLRIASQLAYMVAGPEQTQGQIFEVMQFNDQHPDINPVTGRSIEPEPFLSTRREGADLPSLNLERVVVLTGSGTCSASEALINGLRGIDVEVIQIGADTCGKPYGGYTTDNCGNSYFMPQFMGVNAKGYGDYTDGFYPVINAGDDPAGLPGCRVDDDFGHALGDAQEARLAAAIHYLEQGECPVSSSALLQQYPAAPGETLPSGIGIQPSGEGAIRQPPGINDRLMR